MGPTTLSVNVASPDSRGDRLLDARLSPPPPPGGRCRYGDAARSLTRSAEQWLTAGSWRCCSASRLPCRITVAGYCLLARLGTHPRRLSRRRSAAERRDAIESLAAVHRRAPARLRFVLLSGAPSPPSPSPLRRRDPDDTDPARLGPRSRSGRGVRLDSSAGVHWPSPARAEPDPCAFGPELHVQRRNVGRGDRFCALRRANGGAPCRRGG